MHSLWLFNKSSYVDYVHARLGSMHDIQLLCVPYSLVVCLTQSLCVHTCMSTLIMICQLYAILGQYASMMCVAKHGHAKLCHVTVTSEHSMQSSMPWSSECCLGLFRVLMKLSELCALVPEGHISLQVYIEQWQY